MNIGIHALSHHRLPAPHIRQLIDWLIGEGHQIFLSQAIEKTLDKLGIEPNKFQCFSQKDNLRHLDLFLSLGGDGTILDSIVYTVPDKIPILGINLGRLGFLAPAESEAYQQTIRSVAANHFNIQKRSLIEIHMMDDPAQTPEINFALNEIAISKRDTASMITVSTVLNGEFLNDYWGDGLIISTPTGSTGYSLSCGGPILMPDSKALVITPISPHNLSMRPLVLPDESILEIKPTGRQQKVMLSMDSRSKPILANQKIKVMKSHKTAIFVALPDVSFSKTLREKLFWGKDLRN